MASGYQRWEVQALAFGYQRWEVEALVFDFEVQLGFVQLIHLKLQRILLKAKLN
jgi:hypothetical protein